jgi:hypothetical protein
MAPGVGNGGHMRRKIIAPPPHLIGRRALLRNIAQRTHSNRRSSAALRALERDGFDIVHPYDHSACNRHAPASRDFDFSLDAANRWCLVGIAVGASHDRLRFRLSRIATPSRYRTTLRAHPVPTRSPAISNSESGRIGFLRHPVVAQRRQRIGNLAGEPRSKRRAGCPGASIGTMSPAMPHIGKRVLGQLIAGPGLSVASAWANGFSMSFQAVMNG